MKTRIFKPEQPTELTLEFKNEHEARDLQEELMTWKPTGGWSPLASQFFEALAEVIEGED